MGCAQRAMTQSTAGPKYSRPDDYPHNISQLNAAEQQNGQTNTTMSHHVACVEGGICVWRGGMVRRTYPQARITNQGEQNTQRNQELRKFEDEAIDKCNDTRNCESRAPPGAWKCRSEHYS